MWGNPYYGNWTDTYAERELNLSPGEKSKNGMAIARDGQID
jgi:hypothetical protein